MFERGRTAVRWCASPGSATTGGMRLRVGLVAGFAAGAYIATVAQQRSRQLSQQVNQKVNRSARRGAIDAVAGKAKAAVDLGVERAKDIVAEDPGATDLPAVSLDPKRLGMSSVVFGAVLILVMIALPTGIGGLLRRLLGPLTSRLYSRS